MTTIAQYIDTGNFERAAKRVAVHFKPRLLCLILPLVFLSTGLAEASTLMFRSGFEPGTHTDSAVISPKASSKRLLGYDSTTNYKWEDFLKNVPILNNNSFSFDGCTTNEDAFVNIVDDPEGKRGKVMHYQVNQETGGGVTCRIENHFGFVKPFKSICLRYKFRVSEAYEAMKADSNLLSWLSINEMWTGTGGARGSLGMGLRKEGRIFFFRVLMRHFDGSKYIDDWFFENRVVPVMFGKWVEVVHYVKGGPAGTGRFYYSWNGQVVFDVKNEIVDYNNMGWAYGSFLKFYQGAPYLDFLRNRGTPASCWYDDLEIWDSLPPNLTTDIKASRPDALVLPENEGQLKIIQGDIITFQASSAAAHSITVYGLNGRSIASFSGSGNRSYRWCPRGKGVYLARFQTNGMVKDKVLIINSPL